MPSTWTRADLLNVAVAYADRYDTDVSDQLSFMLGLAEDRMSRIMRNREMSATLSIPVTGASFYTLPSDFAGMRDINVNGQYTLQYVNPEQATNVKLHKANCTYYTIVGNTLHIIPLLEVVAGNDDTIEIIYYQRVVPLVASLDTNWVLTNHSDIYKTALSAEIEVFVKNDQRAAMFWGQLDSMFGEIENRDWQDRWSGTSLATKLEVPSRGY
jgi:hypothetical protein